MLFASANPLLSVEANYLNVLELIFGERERTIRAPVVNNDHVIRWSGLLVKTIEALTKEIAAVPVDDENANSHRCPAPRKVSGPGSPGGIRAYAVGLNCHSVSVTTILRGPQKSRTHLQIGHNGKSHAINELCNHLQLSRVAYALLMSRDHGDASIGQALEPLCHGVVVGRRRECRHAHARVECQRGTCLRLRPLLGHGVGTGTRRAWTSAKLRRRP